MSYEGVDQVLLVREITHHNYAGLYNMPGGKIEPKHGGCALQALRDEIWEEAGIPIETWHQFDCIFKFPHSDCRFRVIEHKGTPILVGRLADGHDDHVVRGAVNLCNEELQRRQANPTGYERCMLETDDVALFPYKDSGSEQLPDFRVHRPGKQTTNYFQIVAHKVISAGYV